MAQKGDTFVAIDDAPIAHVYSEYITCLVRNKYLAGKGERNDHYIHGLLQKNIKEKKNLLQKVDASRFTLMKVRYMVPIM